MNVWDYIKEYRDLIGILADLPEHEVLNNPLLTIIHKQGQMIHKLLMELMKYESD